jgi:hypothetical protein
MEMIMEQETTAKRRKDHAQKRGHKTQIGGTAVPGAKSTQSKQVPTTNNPAQQQTESYNRTMRRRMDHLGAGPHSELERLQEIQEKRKKRVERKKQRVEERRQEIKKSMPAGSIKLGRRILYFAIGTLIIIVLIIVLALITRYPF